MNRLSGFFRALLFIGSLSATAQDFPGKRDSLYSEILKEKRVIQVALPRGYNPESGEQYEVMYILDEGNIKIISAIQQYNEEEAYMPPIILVALYNIDRDRDFLPSHSSDIPTSGGADKFLSFFKQELIPYINKTYPTNGHNLLFGHSFGGVFATYALLTEPQLFDNYLAVDPSYWWDKGYMNKLAARKIEQQLPTRKSIYITGREGQEFVGMGLPGMDSVLKSKAPKELNWKVVSYANETHGSVRLKSIYDGLKFFYEGYTNQPIQFHPMNGIVLKDRPYRIFYFGSSQVVHYSTDGTAPTEVSPKMVPVNTLTNGAKLSAKSFGNYHEHNKITTGEFILGQPLAAVSKPRNIKPGGFRYTYYEGEWDKLPDFKQLKPVKSGITDKDFNVSKLPKATHFACLVEGFLEIQQDGYYIFVLDSDDGSKLFLGDKLLIDYDGLHGGGNDKTFLVPLTKGFYPIRLEFFQKAGGASLRLMYVLPDEANPRPINIPVELQYSKG